MKKTKFLAGMLVIAGILEVLLILGKTTFVIEKGIVLYRTLFIACSAVCLVLLAALLILLGAAAAKRREETLRQNDAARSQKERQAAESAAAADLSVKKKLDAAAIRQILNKEKTGRWSLLEDEISSCISQLDRMDQYQARLKELLALNDALSLKDTEDVLDQVEQYLCKNMRKAINYLNILDPESAEDAKAARKKLHSCAEENEDSLKRTQEFLIALTDFLNQQGDGTGEIDLLDVYKNTILDSIRE